jgi:hypothetical protein
MNPLTIGDHIQRPEESKRTRALSWLLWWQTDPVDIDEQARLYDTMSVWSSWRGWAAICLCFSALITFAMIAFSGFGASSGALIDVAIMLGLALFSYRGHRWAMIGAMTVWTIEKFFAIAVNPIMAVTVLIWWALYMHVFYCAFRVEQRRRKAPVVEVAIFD